MDLASAARVTEIHALSLEESNYREESVGIRLLSNSQFLAKTPESQILFPLAQNYFLRIFFFHF